MNSREVVFKGPVTTRSGYGEHSRDIVRALFELGYDVKIIPTRWGATPQDAIDQSNPVHKKIMDNIVNRLDKKPAIFVHCTIPNEFETIGYYNIGITAGIETNLCAPEWIEGCNKMDLIITTSNHSKTVFQASKYKKFDKNTNQVIGLTEIAKPLEVLFEGVDLEVFKRTNEIHSSIHNELSNITEDFCFLFVGHWLQGGLGADRKDIGMMIKVFIETFRKKKSTNRPALLLKTSGATFSTTDLYEIRRKIEVILSSYEGNSVPNVYVLHGDLTAEEMNSLYNHPKIKAMVSFTHGEGFGRPLLEFTTSGKPVIASNWSGQVDFLHPEYSVLLPGTLTQVDDSAINEWIIKDSKWFTVNYIQASAVLKRVFEEYDLFLTQSRKHMQHTKNNFSFVKMVEKFGEMLNSLDEYQKLAKLPKLIKTNQNGVTEVGGKIELPKLKKVTP